MQGLTPLRRPLTADILLSIILAAYFCSGMDFLLYVDGPSYAK